MKTVKYGLLTQLITFPGIFPVNCYLVEEENELTLVDAAMPFSAASIIREIEQIGKPLTRILLTHAHEDHVGALDRLKEAYPSVQVAISERDALLMAGDMSLVPGEAAVPIRGGVPKKLKTRPDVLLRDGDMIGSLRAVAAPGHTPGLMAFIDVRSNAVIAGDALQTHCGVAVAGQLVWLFPFPKFGTWHAETALSSARKLLDLKPSLLAVGHGEVLVDPVARMEAAVRQAERTLGGESGSAKTGA